MKKIIIFFIILTLAITLSMVEKPETIEGRELTEQEIEEYKNSLIEKYNKYNRDYTEKELEYQINNYKASVERGHTEKGVSFKEAFPRALKISVVICAIVAVIFFVKGCYYNELLSSGMWTQGRGMTSEGRREIKNVEAKRNFWGKWFG